MLLPCRSEMNVIDAVKRENETKVWPTTTNPNFLEKKKRSERKIKYDKTFKNTKKFHLKIGVEIFGGLPGALIKKILSESPT